MFLIWKNNLKANLNSALASAQRPFNMIAELVSV